MADLQIVQSGDDTIDLRAVDDSGDWKATPVRYDEAYNQPAALLQGLPASNFFYVLSQAQIEAKTDLFADGAFTSSYPTYVFNSGSLTRHNEILLAGFTGNKQFGLFGSPGDGPGNAFPTSDEGVSIWVAAGDGGSDGSGGAGGDLNHKVGNETVTGAGQGTHYTLDGNNNVIQSINHQASISYVTVIEGIGDVVSQGGATVTLKSNGNHFFLDEGDLSAITDFAWEDDLGNTITPNKPISFYFTYTGASLRQFSNGSGFILQNNVNVQNLDLTTSKLVFVRFDGTTYYVTLV